MTINDTFLLMFAKVTETLLIHEESTYYYVISVSIYYRNEIKTKKIYKTYVLLNNLNPKNQK